MKKRIFTVILSLVFIMTFVPTALAAPDTTPPELTSVTLNSGTLNRGDTLTVTIPANEISGFKLDRCWVSFHLPNAVKYEADLDSFMVRLNTDYQNGAGVQGSIVLDKMLGGTYKLLEVYLEDKEGNPKIYTDCNGNRPDVSFNLTSDYVKPTTQKPQGPNITAFNVSKTTATVGDTVDFTMTGSDPTGIISATVKLFHMDSRYEPPYYVKLQLADGDTYTGTFTVPADMADGRYQIEGTMLAGSGGSSLAGAMVIDAQNKINIINPAVKPIPSNPEILTYLLSTHELTAGQPVTVTITLDYSIYSMIDNFRVSFVPMTYNNTNKKGFGGNLNNMGNGLFTGTIYVPYNTYPGEYVLFGFSAILPNKNIMGFSGPKSDFVYRDGDSGYYLRHGLLNVNNPISVSGTGDETIIQGSQFDAMAGVSVQSSTNGDITNKVNVSGGKFDTNVPGMYLVKYNISDTANIDGSASVINYTDYRWIGVTKIEPQSGSEGPLAISNDKMAVGASNSDVSIKKDGANVGYSDTLTEPGVYTLSSGGTSNSSAQGSIHTYDLSNASSVTAVIDQSGPIFQTVWLKNKATGMIDVFLKPSDVSGTAEIRYMSGTLGLDACRDGGTVTDGKFSVSGYGNYTIYTKDGLGNEAVKTLNINKASYGTAYLEGVKLSAGTLNKAFSSITYSYNIMFPEKEGSVTITPIKLFDSEVLTINGKSADSKTVAVKNGKSATVKVKVKLGNSTKTYTFKITRASSADTTLRTLKATAGTFDAPFDPSLKKYTLNLDKSVSKVKITASASSPFAKVSPSSAKYTLKPGQSKTIKIKVKAQSKATDYYYITIVRAS